MLEHIPVVTLRDEVIFPGSTMYLEVGRSRTIRAMNHAMHGNKYVFTVAQIQVETENPTSNDLFEIGTLSEVRQIIKMPDRSTRVVLSGVRRMRLAHFFEEEDCYYGDLEEYPEEPVHENAVSIVARIRELKELFRTYGELEKEISKKSIVHVLDQTTLDTVIDAIVTDLPIHYHLKQNILEETNLLEREQNVSMLLQHEISILRVQEKIRDRVKNQVENNQKEYYLREQLKAIHKELGEDDAVTEIEKYQKELSQLSAPQEVKEKIGEEIRRLKKMNSTSSESAVIRGYIETLLHFPWEKASEETLDINVTQSVLDQDHYGMEKVKERVLECLAVRALHPEGKSPIICLVGPPGTGKTSIAKSIATSMNREYVRICLGGVRDEAELRGHRRTYVGAMPGRIVAGLQKAGVKNPLLLFDEIDKMGTDYKGDPASALLEILDPQQNQNFSDHYVELPIDLSQVMFLCTANSLDTISKPLLDRMEIIELSGYTQLEKFHIAKEHLWEKELAENGLKKSQIHITDKALRMIIANYTKESGVRGLQKQLAKICRKAALQLLQKENPKIRISANNLSDYLGKEKYHPNMANQNPQIGIVRGLAWTSVGGETLEIEVNVMSGTGKLVLTGKLGEVMQESARIALSFVRTQIDGQIAEDFFEKNDIHIHVPEGAVPKDGPSAGVTMATAIYSAITSKKVCADIAMTGEITLRGRVLPIGGLQEKLLAAKMAGIKRVCIPHKNMADLAELSSELREGIEVYPCLEVKDIWKLAFLSV